MELNVYDRMTLINVLPKQGDITTLRIVNKLREALSFSEEEHKALQFQRVYHCQVCGEDTLKPTCEKCGGVGAWKGRMIWRREADVPADIPIGEKATDIITEALKDLNRQKKLTPAHLPLYERFVPGS